MNRIQSNGELKSMSDFSGLAARPFRILVGGYINLNVIDGSAFFLAGVCAMCAQVPNIEVVLVSANPISRREVVSELDIFPNVTVVDPFEARGQLHLKDSKSASNVSREQYASVVSEWLDSEEFDAVIIRDTEVGLMLSERSSEFRSKGCVYVTGVTSNSSDISRQTRQALAKLHALEVKLLFQTQDMLDRLEALDIEVDSSRVSILPPHVPDVLGPRLTKAERNPEKPVRFIYAGKFFPAWNVDLILAGFKAAKSRSLVRMELDVAGNQFREDPHQPSFIGNVKYLLENTPGIHWLGGMTRWDTREAISKADVGISWRRPSLDYRIVN